MSVAGRENISPIILALTLTNWIWTRLQLVSAAVNLTACEGYESTRHGECKSNDGLMNQEYPHSIQEPIVELQRPGDIPSKPRIQWPKGNQTATWTNLDQELSFWLTTHLKGPIDHQLSSFCRIIYDVCLELSGAVTDKKDKTEGKRPNRRQIQEGKLRSEQRMLKRRFKEAPRRERFGDHSTQILIHS